MQVITRHTGRSLVVLDARTSPPNVTPHSAALPSQYLFSTNNPMPWVPAVKTDIRATFARVQQQMKRGVK